MTPGWHTDTTPTHLTLGEMQRHLLVCLATVLEQCPVQGPFLEVLPTVEMIKDRDQAWGCREEPSPEDYVSPASSQDNFSTGVCLSLCSSTEQVPMSSHLLLPSHQLLCTTHCLFWLPFLTASPAPCAGQNAWPWWTKDSVLLPSLPSSLTPTIQWPPADLTKELHGFRKRTEVQPQTWISAPSTSLPPCKVHSP